MTVNLGCLWIITTLHAQFPSYQEADAHFNKKSDGSSIVTIPKNGIVSLGFLKNERARKCLQEVVQSTHSSERNLRFPEVVEKIFGSKNPSDKAINAGLNLDKLYKVYGSQPRILDGVIYFTSLGEAFEKVENENGVYETYRKETELARIAAAAPKLPAISPPAPSDSAAPVAPPPGPQSPVNPDPIDLRVENESLKKLLWKIGGASVLILAGVSLALLHKLGLLKKIPAISKIHKPRALKRNRPTIEFNKVAIGEALKTKLLTHLIIRNDFSNLLDSAIDYVRETAHVPSGGNSKIDPSSIIIDPKALTLAIQNADYELSQAEIEAIRVKYLQLLSVKKMSSLTLKALLS